MLKWERKPVLLVNHFLAEEKLMSNGTYQKCPNDNTANGTLQALYNGNRCGFNLDSPYIYQYGHQQKRRPPKIEKALKNLAKSYSDPHFSDFGSMAYDSTNPTKKGGYRLIRAESRHFTNNVLLQVLLSYTCLKNMFFGMRLHDGFKFYDVNFIVKEVNAFLEDRGFSYRVTAVRVRKYLRKLHSLDIVTLHKAYYIRKCGKIGAVPMRIQINKEIFKWLNIDDHALLESQRHQESEFQKIITAKAIEKHQFKIKREKKRKMEENKNLKVLLQRATSGNYLSPEDRKILDQDCPGWDRKRETNQLYPDYTGCSDNSNMFHEKVSRSSATLLSALANKLKPPS